MYTQGAEATLAPTMDVLVVTSVALLQEGLGGRIQTHARSALRGTTVQAAATLGTATRTHAYQCGALQGRVMRKSAWQI